MVSMFLLFGTGRDKSLGFSLSIFKSLPRPGVIQQRAVDSALAADKVPKDGEAAGGKGWEGARTPGAVLRQPRPPPCTAVPAKEELIIS